MVRWARSPRAEALGVFAPPVLMSRARVRWRLLASQAFDFHEREGVDHGSQDLPGYPRVESAVRGDVFDSCQHLVLSLPIHDAHCMSLFEVDDLPDEPSALDEKLPEMPVEFVKSVANIGQTVLWPVLRCHAPILTFTPDPIFGPRSATRIDAGLVAAITPAS